MNISIQTTTLPFLCVAQFFMSWVLLVFLAVDVVDLGVSCLCVKIWWKFRWGDRRGGEMSATEWRKFVDFVDGFSKCGMNDDEMWMFLLLCMFMCVWLCVRVEESVYVYMSGVKSIVQEGYEIAKEHDYGSVGRKVCCVDGTRKFDWFSYTRTHIWGCTLKMFEIVWKIFLF